MGVPARAGMPRQHLRCWVLRIGVQYRSDGLDPELEAELLKIPGMASRLQSWDDPFRSWSWSQCVERLATWTAKHGALPKQGKLNSEESRLASWLQQILELYRSERLDPELGAELLEIPGMVSRLKSREKPFRIWTWSQRVERLTNLTAKHGALLKWGTQDSQASRIARWVLRIGVQYRSEGLDPELEAELLRIPGMASRL